MNSTLHELLEGTHPAWVPFLKLHHLMGAAEEALAKVKMCTVAPKKELIFECFRYFGPEDTLVVIIGQDPYPKGAQGLCFSVPHGSATPPSLRSIMKNLAYQGHAPRKISGDLRAWASQGVLLLNAALTTRGGARGSHRRQWRTFTQGLVAALAKTAVAQKRPLVFMLWGNDAKSLAPSAAGSTILSWSHPSPCADNCLPLAQKFVNAPHFGDANRTLILGGSRQIVWDSMGDNLVFTDGACTRNGRPGAIATFAVMFMCGMLRQVEISGRLAEREYKLVDEKNPALGFVTTEKTVAPTNNRGEYLAWCWALLLLVRGEGRGDVEVVSDCKLFISTMNEWLPTRRLRGTAEELSNFDIISIAEVLLATLRERATVTLTHIHSHRPRPAGLRAQALWYGNFRADQIASNALKSSDAVVLSIMPRCPALAWRLMGQFEESA